MEENVDFSFDLPEKADIHLFIFPYLEKFLIIDLRSDSTHIPTVKLLSMREVFDEDFYKQVEGEFSQLLRKREGVFLNLMSLPLRLQTLLQEKGIQAVLERIGRGEKLSPSSSISVFICAGQVLSTADAQLAKAVKEIFGPEAQEPLVDSCIKSLQELFREERGRAKEMERQELRDTIEGRSDSYLTLWQDEPPAQK